jgi:hypothetical protein
MRVKVTCTVEPVAKVSILKGILGDWEYNFIPNEEGLLEKIIIETKVPDPSKYKIWSGDNPYNPENPKGTLLHIDIDEEFNKIIIEQFQYFEGMLALLGSPVKIDWQSPYIETIPESEEEKENRIGGIRVSRVQSRTIRDIDDNNVGNMIKRAYSHSYFINSYLSFFTEAVREIRSFKFINSFFNSYFILEGVYGNDKWRNYQVEEEFKNSDDFKKFTHETIDNYINQNDVCKNKIVEMISNLKDRNGNSLNAQFDTNGIASLLVNTRGALHHFSSDPEKQKVIPFNHDEFEYLAYVTLRIAELTIFELSKEVDQYMEKIQNEPEKE